MASENALVASWASSSANPGHRTDQSLIGPIEGDHTAQPTSIAQSPVLNATTTLRTAAGSRLDKVVEEQTAAAARAPVHNPMTYELVAFGYDRA